MSAVEATKEQMKDARLPIAYRDECGASSRGWELQRATTADARAQPGCLFRSTSAGARLGRCHGSAPMSATRMKSVRWGTLPFSFKRASGKAHASARTGLTRTHARTHAGQYEEYKKRVALLKESKKEPAKKH